jgi:predicted YcjX-like family ATPase
MDWLGTARGLLPVRRTVRIGVTGLARSGKTALLTSLAANLLAAGAGLPALPALTARLAGRSFRVTIAPSGADPLPRFNVHAHLAAMAADPPDWPARTQTVSLLALDLEIGQAGVLAALPAQHVRLEVLDYPGEWLLDLPLLGQSFAEWSDGALRRLERHRLAADFLAFANALPEAAPADEALAATGHRLYRTLLNRLRQEDGMSLLQPGRFLRFDTRPAKARDMEPPWMGFFPLRGGGRLGDLLSSRYDAYCEDVRAQLVAPSFGRVDRLVVLADLLSALHAGQDAFADAAAALETVAGALRWAGPSLLPDWLAGMLGLRIGRVAFAATKADHVADRQRGNLAALAASLTRVPAGAGTRTGAFAIASVRCTEDVVWTLDGHPVSAVRGRLVGAERAGRSYPGEVPDKPPGGEFWAHPFLALPDFEPMRLPLGGRAGVPHVNLDTLLVFLLDDVL